MKECVIISHLGLGDLILISGLAVYLAERYDVVRFPCRTQDENSVRSFFFLQPKIHVYSFKADSTTPANFPLYHATDDPDVVRLGFYSNKIEMDRKISFAENFYKQAGVDYSVRWDKCPIQEVVDKFYNAFCLMDQSAFIHEDLERGFAISGEHLLGIKPKCHFVAKKNNSSILAFYPFIKWSEQIHVIDGPFLHLAESVETNGELYYHKYARPLSARWNDIDCPTRKKWNVLQ